MKVWLRVLRGLTLAGVVLGGGFAVSGTATMLMVSPLMSTSAQAQASSIIVEGNRRVEADTIRSYFRSGGRGLDAMAIDDALKALYATGLFEDVRISQAGGRLKVTVVENPVINRIQFEGNKRLKDEQLLGEIQSKPRGTLSRPAVQGDVQRIVELYRRAGRYDVRVEPKMIDRPNNRVDLVFEVSEGSKTGVRELRFVGNRAYSDWRLKDVIKTSQSNFLSFLKNTDIYDPDRLEADRELLRRFYLKHGYADVRIVSAVAEFDPSRNGFVVTFQIDEGDLYRFGPIEVQSNIRDVDPAVLRAKLRMSSGGTYNAELVEKSVEDMTIELSKRGYAFSQVRPRGDRDPEGRLISVVFVVDEGPRVYVERIQIRGNTRTRDYVIRREFDLAEGDAYNRVLVDRAERRLKNLNFFKTVKISNEPGSAQDRIVLVVDVEEQPTGDFSVAGGYSTADGFVGEVSVTERNLLGLGQMVRGAVSYGQKTRGLELSFVEPYFLDYRLALGLDFFAKQVDSSSYYTYRTETIGGAVRLGFPITENLNGSIRYSAFQQKITLDDRLANCTAATLPAVVGFAASCYADGEASIAIREMAREGAAFVSLVGWGLAYNTLDNAKLPTSGMVLELKQDIAGVGGDVNYLRTTGDARLYYELISDFVAMFRVQGGHVTGWGSNDLRMVDHFQMGPNLVRGFAPGGLGPRDLTPGTNLDPLGGSMYWGTSVEVQFPFFAAPKDFGMKFAVFADAGSVWNYQGQTFFPSTGERITLVDPVSGVNSNEMHIRSSVGAGVIWQSPFGPIRIDYAFPLTKEPFDRTQNLRFSGGTRF
jgi:outer membrane protein insertion porin family